jgi:hypothetical protein
MLSSLCLGRFRHFDDLPKTGPLKSGGVSPVGRLADQQMNPLRFFYVKITT